MFTTYEIYEHLPDIGAIPLLKLTEDSPTHEEWSTIAKSIDTKPREIMETKNKPKGNFLSTVQSLISRIGGKIDFPKLASQLISMFL